MRQTEVFHSLVILIMLFVTGAWTLARPSRVAAVVLVLVALAEIIWNGPLEGRTLLSFTAQHGVTESDLLAVAGFCIAGWALWRSR